MTTQIRDIRARIAGGPSNAIVAHVLTQKDGRVSGYVTFSGYSAVDFNVKHDDRGFSVGSGSSKHRFYFADEIKE